MPRWGSRFKKIDPDNIAQRRAAFARMDEDEAASGRSGESTESKPAAERVNYAPAVRGAIERGVTDIGQISAEDKRALNDAVKRGYLIKTQDYNYPNPKTRWVVNPEYANELFNQGVLEFGGGGSRDSRLKPGYEFFPNRYQPKVRIIRRVDGGWIVRPVVAVPGSFADNEMLLLDSQIQEPTEKAVRLKWGRRFKSLYNTPLNLLVAKVHRAYTTAADELFMRGYISQDERKGFGKLIGDFLGSLRDGVMSQFPGMATTMVSPSDVDEVAATKQFSPLTVYKAADGAYRWVLISSNAFEDRDGEIVSQKALEADVSRADADRDYGPLRWWHIPGADIGACTFNMMHGRMLVEGGTFKSAAIAEMVQRHSGELGVSIGFTHPPAEPDNAGVFHTIRRFERSLLPQSIASNPFTAVTFASKESNMPTLGEKIKAFATFMSVTDETARGMLAVAESAEKSALDANTRHKAAKADDEEKPAGEEAEKPFPPKDGEDDEEKKKKTKSADVPAVIGDMTPAEFTTFLATALKEFSDRLSTLETTSRTKAASDAEQAKALKTYDDKLDKLAATVDEALTGVKELKGELPRVLGDKRSGTFQPSRDGQAPTDETAKRAWENYQTQLKNREDADSGDPMAKHVNAIFKGLKQQ